MKLHLAIAALAAATGSAQENSTSGGRVSAQDLEMTRMERLLQEWRLDTETAVWSRQILARQAADRRRQEFVDRANRFVAAWNKMMRNYTRNGIFNVKEARELSKAFRDLESAWQK